MKVEVEIPDGWVEFRRRCFAVVNREYDEKQMQWDAQRFLEDGIGQKLVEIENDGIEKAIPYNEEPFSKIYDMFFFSHLATKEMYKR